MNLSMCQDTIVRIRDRRGHVLTGAADCLPPENGPGGPGREEAAVRVSGRVIPESEIEAIETLPELAIIRAEETWQQAGAYYVRIQAMARKHHITLRAEFDGHDGPDTKYIVVTDQDFPVATARMYPLDGESVMIGRVVVLPEYRRQGLGSMVVTACERWAEELGFRRAVVESRDNKIGFYEQLMYETAGEPVEGETFRCIRMEKVLSHPCGRG